MGNEVEFTFCIDGREVVRLTPDGEIVFATEVTLSDLRSAVVYLVSKVRASSPSPLTAEEAKERARKIVMKWAGIQEPQSLTVNDRELIDCIASELTTSDKK